MPPTPEKRDTETKSKDDDLIQIIDYGDFSVEIDNRGPVQQRRRLPKSHRGIGVTSKVRHELEERVEAEIVAPAKVYEEQHNTAENLPPEEDEDAVEKREQAAAEAEEAAREYQDKQQEASQKEVRAKN